MPDDVIGVADMIRVSHLELGVANLLSDNLSTGGMLCFVTETQTVELRDPFILSPHAKSAVSSLWQTALASNPVNLEDKK